jgi:hypothetical protein
MIALLRKITLLFTLIILGFFIQSCQKKQAELTDLKNLVYSPSPSIPAPIDLQIVPMEDINRIDVIDSSGNVLANFGYIQFWEHYILQFSRGSIIAALPNRISDTVIPPYKLSKSQIELFYIGEKYQTLLSGVGFSMEYALSPNKKLAIFYKINEIPGNVEMKFINENGEFISNVDIYFDFPPDSVEITNVENDIISFNVMSMTHGVYYIFNMKKKELKVEGTAELQPDGH